MFGKLTGWDDTIVALATPPGVSAIGVIRLSGPNALTIADKLFPSKDLVKQPSHSMHVGFLKDENIVIDEVVLSIYKTPRSYTGEDMVEISGHGSPYVLQQVIDACIRKGARLAKAGEFTQRAFLNGKMDLTQAEAVADLIASNTSASQRTAINSIRGGFSHQLKELRERLVRFSALIELELDFSQEDVEFADRKQLNALINEASEATQSLINSFKLGNVIRNGISVAIVGKPNAGKSTLLNALLNEERAIVSEIPGTTRDTIEEVINIGGVLFRLIDTAGIRQHTSDVIESAGIQRSFEKMKQADLVIYLFDINELSPQALQEAEQELIGHALKYILLANKVDMVDSQNIPPGLKDRSNLLFVSATTRLNLDALREKMVNLVLDGNLEIESSIVINARHLNSLQQLNTSLSDIRKGLANKIPGDLLALDIRTSLHYLGEITGEVTNEEQLDFIFSKFCIGK
ncbi:MAG TPA: tRNA uridine-5-carboxymethylaminomethyl(34) synthesis GTPase MnmE [Chitinophagaceae bacterium]|jgi:tRNA modification GTPase